MIDRRRSVDLGFALGLLSALSLVAAAYMIFFYAPTDSVQGDVQRIFYVHLGAVAGAYASFALVLLAGGFYLIADTRAPGSRFFNPGRALIADRLARTGAQVGLVFTTLVLVVGSLWAKPIWGTYWTWDPRLTATLVLWLTYGAYLMVRRMAISPRQAARLSAVVGVLGFFDVP
ncbi:MAG TPA: cytochrome c biogenesis protein CcsA, partial [Candidatus Dormibacteraeota bacterium]|nr:cytochrome c biogenesis protein CcsA [Candidatus Dormibacteraeota bacterium]